VLRFKLRHVSEQADSLIEQLRSFGVSIEDLEALTGESKVSAEHVDDSPPPPDAPAEPGAPEEPGTSNEPDSPSGAGTSPNPEVPNEPRRVGAFEPLTPESVRASEDASLRAETAVLRQQSVLFDANQTRDRILAEAKDAAAEIRANAVRLVSMKLQAAEEEIMAMRAKATEEVVRLRKETAQALATRLQEAGSEAQALRETARDEAQAFWESASREFSEVQVRISRMHEHMVQLLASLNDAVASLEEAASSIATLCERHLESGARREGSG